MSQFHVTCEIQQEVPVLKVTGYYEKPAGLKVLEEAEKHLEAGKKCLILDLSQCDVLSSPGVSTIVELAIETADNFSGKLIICGLDKLKEKVLKLVGIHTMAEIRTSLAEALQFAASRHG